MSPMRSPAAAFLIGVVTVVGIIMTFLELLGGAVLAPATLALGAPAALVQLLAALLLVRWCGVMPRGSRGIRGLSFWWWAAPVAWGGAAAVMLSVPASGPAQRLAETLDWELISASLPGAWPEEILKALGVTLVLLSFRAFDRPRHGLAIGLLVGAGFEVVENILYGVVGGIEDPVSDASGALSTWLLRLLLGPFLHACCAGIAGWGIGRALVDAGLRPRARWGIALGWWTLALLIHFTWNLSIGDITVKVATMVLSGMPMYGLTAVLLRRARRAARGEREAAARTAAVQPAAGESMGSVGSSPSGR